MSFGGFILTILGRQELAKAETGQSLVFDYVAVGDGSSMGSSAALDSLVHELYQLPVLSVARDGDTVIVDAELSNDKLETGFYFREIGLFANGVLYAYDNAGQDAEYIDAAGSAVAKLKRVRIALKLSSEAVVTVKMEAGLYALYSDLQAANEEIEELKEEKVDKETGKGLSTNDFTNEEKEKLADTYSKEYINNNFAPGCTLTTQAFTNKGWYRIAKLHYVNSGYKNLANARGAINYSCELSMKRDFSNLQPEVHKIQLLSHYTKSKIVDIYSLCQENKQLITNVRHTVDTNNFESYIEIYYSENNANTVTLTLTDNYNERTHFKLIEPELTSDTVSGVNILSTLELPANFDIDYLYKKLNVGKDGYSYPYNCIMTSELNLNNVNESGLYFCESPINGPDTLGNGFMIAITYAREIRGMQLYITLTEDAIYKRQNVSGTWGNWKEIKAGSATSATKLETSRTIGLSGDVTGSTSFDGTANKTITATLANSGVTAGTYGPLELVSKNGSVWVSNNSGLHNTSAISTWTAKQNCKVSFKYTVSSESSTYDYLKVTVGGTTIVDKKGGPTVQSDTVTTTLSAGQALVFTYQKDSSSNSGIDRAEISEVKYGAGTNTPSTVINENNIKTYFTIYNSEYGFYLGIPMSNFTVDAKGRITKAQTVYVSAHEKNVTTTAEYSDFTVFKNGNVISIFYEKLRTMPQVYTKIATLAEEYRPRKDLFVVGGGSAVGQSFFIYINIMGEVHIYSTTTTEITWRAVITYVV